ncbi:MAG: alpha-glucosidase [Alphaproteobacteria bacterium]|nr:alpha-glucosidase [Alphaproteobacteria bacterium]
MTEWWRKGVIYQVYPRSYLDNNGDGIGDLSGVTQKLDYIASLGVDAIWLSPFFKSPMKDAGYDIEDYRAVDPTFGTLDDFRRLLDEAHKRNIKIVIDQVWAHTADTHAWFSESRQSKSNPKADWYYWRDAKPDGTAPNNWLSNFGGVAWSWDTRREQYYLHHYLSSQPKLNLRNPEVKAEIFDTARFWLELGVDGFRLDVLHQYLSDPELRDNPPRGDRALPNDLPASHTLTRQWREMDCNHPDIVDLAEDLRALCDEYPDKVLLAEVGGEDNEAEACKYVQTGKRLHLAYTFGLMQQQGRFDKALVYEIMNHVEGLVKDGWLCWATGNHDNMRVVSRWPNEGADPVVFARFALAIGLCLRGSFCMYQGEELGLPEAEVPYDLMQDPYGIAFYPEYRGRDGCRTPMPWIKSAKHAGFSDAAKTWLPVVEAQTERAVDVQDKDPESMLNFTRKFLAWRKQQPPISVGSFQFFETPDNVVGFVREHEGERISCIFNIQNAAVTLPIAGKLDPISQQAQHGNGQLSLGGYGFAFIKE